MGTFRNLAGSPDRSFLPALGAAREARGFPETLKKATSRKEASSPECGRHREAS